MISTFYLPTKLIFGPGSIAQLGSVAKDMGKKAFLVTGSGSMRKTGTLDKVVMDLKNNGVQSYVFDKIEPNPRSSTVDEGARLAREQKPDLIIGLGGGSAMDAAKAIMVASTGSELIWRYVMRQAKIEGPVMPLILVPTVAGSGSEASIVTVVTNWETHEKRALLSPLLYPRVSIIDPELTLTLSGKTVARGGVDTFLHVAERYITARAPFVLSDGIMETTMKMVVESLPRALAKLNDIEPRISLSWASTVANSPIVEELGGSGGAPTLHGVAHPLSALYDIAHADSLAALLIAWMRYTLPVKKERFNSLGKRVFGKSDGILATEKWLEKVGMKIRLRDLGVDKERITELAENSIMTGPVINAHPIPLDLPAIKKIYQDSY